MKKEKYKKLTIMYFLYFLFAISLALLAYVNSSFLKTIIDVKWVGIVFTLSYIIVFFVIDFFDKALHKLKERRMMNILLILDVAALLTVAFAKHIWLVIPAFITYLVITVLIRILLDVFSEGLSNDSETGRIRGKLFTATNLGWIITPILAGMLLDRFGFSSLYVISSMLLIPILFTFLINFKNYKDTKFEKAQLFFHTTQKVFKNKDIKNIFLTVLCLNIFYSIMVIYVPLHLLSLGFTWTQIGFTVFIMLLPFVILQYPAGLLADKVLGEKEMLIGGFLIAGTATGALFFFSSPVMWIILLCCTRIGAALIEILGDSYFYKHVTSKNINLISFFRRSIPIGYAIGPLIATIVLKFTNSIPSVFLVLGILLILGVYFPTRIKDTL